VVEISEDAILESAIDGDSEAFGVLYERYVGKIFNYIYYRVGNVSDAEDLTERVFLRALRHINNYTHRGLPVSAWLYRIAHNLVANWHRDNSRRKDVPLDEGMLLTQHFNFPEHELLRSEERNRLLAVIHELPEERQELLILKFVDDLSNAEIGRVMGRTEGAIKSLYHRTLLSIRDDLVRLAILPDTHDPSADQTSERINVPPPTNQKAGDAEPPVEDLNG
jgi:RNA polymerase sigma-70 factor (ECF subfamily)